MGPEQEKFWSLLSRAEAINQGLEKYEYGWSLMLGNTLFYFSASPFPNLAGIADVKNMRIWADSMYNWCIEYSKGETSAPNKSAKSWMPEKGDIQFNNLQGAGWEIIVTGITDSVEVCISYNISMDGRQFEEKISITNKENEPVGLIHWNFGAARRLTCKVWPEPVPDIEVLRAAAVPWRRLMLKPGRLKMHCI